VSILRPSLDSIYRNHSLGSATVPWFGVSSQITMQWVAYSQKCVHCIDCILFLAKVSSRDGLVGRVVDYRYCILL